MSRYHQFQVVDPEGVTATLLKTSRFLDESREALIRTADGEEVLVRNDFVEAMGDNTYRLSVPLRTLSRASNPVPASEWVNDTSPAPPDAVTRTMDAGERAVIPAIEERLKVEREKVETGRIRLQKRVEESSAVVDEPLLHEGFHVERVPVNRVLTDGVTPEPRHEGEVLVLPVVEEVLVVEKRLVLREEIRVTPERRETRDPQTHTLRREHIK